MEVVLIAIIALSLLASCRAHSYAAERDTWGVVESDNLPYHANEIFPAYESFYNPRLQELRDRYDLDAVVARETDEWRRILFLRHWIKQNIAINDPNPTKTRGDAFAILDAARVGGGFHCAHFSIVQDAVLNSFGYLTRRIGCGPGTLENGGHHGTNEVWVNSLGKWVMVDAKYNIHFEKDGVPLSVLDIRDAVWRDNAAGVEIVTTPERTRVPQENNDGLRDNKASTYRWCAWEMATNRFTAFPAQATSALVMYDDEIFQTNTWIRDGKPYWAYDTPFLIAIPNRHWIEWTPGVIRSAVSFATTAATIRLTSCTPNFRSFQRLRGDGVWEDCDDRIAVNLVEPAAPANTHVFRTINLFGVTGTEHTVSFQRNEVKGA